jgi:hypothetical protein
VIAQLIRTVHPQQQTTSWGGSLFILYRGKAAGNATCILEKVNRIDSSTNTDHHVIFRSNRGKSTSTHISLSNP